MNWDEYFINIAEQVKLKSKDNNTQIGVVIVGKDNEIAERQDRPEKYFWFEHAERNAIYNAARIGVSTLGTTMYMTCGISCADCARAIINSGISKIILRKGKGATNPIWQESAQRSTQMFTEAGVIVEYYD